jgi:hypothetical protein
MEIGKLNIICKDLCEESLRIQEEGNQRIADELYEMAKRITQLKQELENA